MFPTLCLYLFDFYETSLTSPSLVLLFQFWLLGKAQIGNNLKFRVYSIIGHTILAFHERSKKARIKKTLRSRMTTWEIS